MQHQPKPDTPGGAGRILITAHYSRAQAGPALGGLGRAAIRRRRRRPPAGQDGASSAEGRASNRAERGFRAGRRNPPVVCLSLPFLHLTVHWMFPSVRVQSLPSFHSRSLIHSFRSIPLVSIRPPLSFRPAPTPFTSIRPFLPIHFHAFLRLNRLAVRPVVARRLEDRLISLGRRSCGTIAPTIDALSEPSRNG